MLNWVLLFVIYVDVDIRNRTYNIQYSNPTLSVALSAETGYEMA
jgi:hypothetical protein